MPTARAESILLSLGSNIEPEANLACAVELLGRRLRVVGVSRVFETQPVGRRDAPIFLNAAVEVEGALSPRELKFQLLRPLERGLGRVRTADRNAPRTLDVDISLFGSRVVNDPEADLVIPDPEILTRAHVALPLADLAPDRRHPLTGVRLAEIAARLAPGAAVRVHAEPLRWSPPKRGGEV